MQKIKRVLQDQILAYLKPQRAALVFGPRRVGKTVLMNHILDTWPGKTLFLNGEDYDTHALLERQSAANYRRLLERIELLVLDEAQAVPGIGAKLKLMVDEVPETRIIATGSSSFDLRRTAGEPLVGRSAQFTLLPFTQAELAAAENALETRQRLEDRLIFGSYPEAALMDDREEKIRYLKDLVNGYLLKDILSYEGIKHSGKLMNLLRLIVFQTGNEVSYDELGRQLGMSKNTVEKYLGLLASVFVVYRLGTYAKNLRSEVSRAGKWYFYDNGIRNAVIGDFSPLALRQDRGFLWESYCIGERIKTSLHRGLDREYFFWRTYDGQEIDLIEKVENAITAFEFKMTEQKVKIPTAFDKAYPSASFMQVHRENYLDFIC